MKRLVVLFIGLTLFTGCATSGPLDWVRRNTIHVQYEVDQEKVMEREARIIESWPTTTLVLRNHAAVKSEVILDYCFPGWIDPAQAKIIMDSFQLRYEIPPKTKGRPGEKRVIVPAQITVKMKVINQFNRDSFRREINTSDAIFASIIDVTPPGAEKIWRGETSRVMVNFFNPSRETGQLVVEKADSGIYEKEYSAHGDNYSSGEREKLRMQKVEPVVQTVMPGATAPLHLTQGYYKFSLKGKRSLHYKVQVANGRLWDEQGNPLSPYFEFYLLPGEPSVNARKLNVPHNH